jgi:hypothetical protein
MSDIWDCAFEGEEREREREREMYEEKEDCALVVWKLLVPPPPSIGVVKWYIAGIVG